jgi:hypothetical protein
VKRAAVCIAALVICACSDASNYEQAIAVLIDVSGTYANEKGEVARIVKREILPNLVPGDTIAIVRVDSESYQKDNMEALVTLDRRPSRANAQKLQLAEQLDAFAELADESKYTDIRGAMMLAADYLSEVEAQSRVILVFSDMQEDLPPGAKRAFKEDEFKGIQVIAVNVKQLGSDTADPEAFRKRLSSWERDLQKARASGWRTVMDSAKLAPLLAQVR